MSTNPRNESQSLGRQEIETDLTRRMAQGDDGALGQLFDMHATPVFGLARRILGNDADAEEVSQDVFLNFWRRAAQFDPARGSILGYLLTLTRTSAIDKLRHRRARPDMASEGERLQLASELDVPLDLLSAGDGHGLVRKALTALPAEERRVLELAYFEGLSQSEIAEKTQSPLGTVKGRARNGLRRLRECLPRGLGGDGE